MPTPEIVVYGIFALIGAVVRFVMRGVFTLRAFLMGLASVGFAVPLATLVIYFFLPEMKDAPIWVPGSVYTIVAVFSLTVFERIEKLNIEWTGFGGKIASPPDDELP